MTSDGIWGYSWKNGTQLASMASLSGSKRWNFTYNAAGMRTQRTDGTTTYKYVYNGSLLSQLTIVTVTNTNATVTRTLYFTYDASGTPLSVTYNGTTYYYVTNLQGDVVAILDNSGSEVVTYIYDAWGNLVNIDGALFPTLGEFNPLRYRGYIYDEETGLYYLQSRYYNPEWGRFISTDSLDILTATPMSLTDKNLYAYCDNNPVTREDSDGDFWDTVFDVVSLVVSVVEVIKNPDDPMAWIGLAGDTVDLIPFVSGVGEFTRLVTKADDVVDATVDTFKAVNKAANSLDARKILSNTQTAVKVHGNSLATTKETVGYALRKNGTHEIMKFGETTRGTRRYTNKFYIENDVYMDIMARGTKYDMHYWQHDQILNYYEKYGHRPPWNKSNW